MRLNTRWITIVAALSLAVASACGSKPKKQTTSSTGTAAPGPTKHIPKPAKVQEATGDIRDLLLSLRRVHFGFDTNTLTPQARQALQEAGDKLAVLPKVHIYVEGHADERGTSEYNIALADGRARTVADYLISLGVDANRMHVLSMGEETPLVSGKSQVAYAKNRRVDFRLMRGDIQFVLADGELVDDEGNLLIDDGSATATASDDDDDGGDDD